ncbi:hypothetical protein IWW48_004094 [Coemansia sp. RSA 1200]|nr:hypothetical protein IWW48_004094 [Coemansia sp. RSA 1200]
MSQSTTASNQQGPLETTSVLHTTAAAAAAAEKPPATTTAKTTATANTGEEPPFFSAYQTPTSTTISNTPSSLSNPNRLIVTRTPSAVDFPGAFTTKPKASAAADQRHAAALNKFGIFPNSMKSKVAEAVGGSLANVVGGVYSFVNYVNPLASSQTPADTADVLQQSAAAAEAAVERANASQHSGAHSNTGTGTGTDTPPTPDSIDGGKVLTGVESNNDSPPSTGMVLQVPSGGTSVAADLDEQCLADANADNPEHNRPPTPTKGAFSRMLRIPAAPVVTDAGRQASNAEYKQAVQKDPVSRNVSERTGLRFKPGSEEKRRYMRRLSKAPQLEAPEPTVPSRRSESSQTRRRSASASVSLSGRASIDAGKAKSHAASSDESASSEESESDSNSNDEMAADEAEVLPTNIEKFYHAAATTQRAESKTRAIEPWRFISPRDKRVKRRVLWRLFLAQEITPEVYIETAAQTAQPQKQPSSPVMSVHEQSAPGLLRRDTAGSAGADASDTGSLRRRMLETAAMRNNSSSNNNNNTSESKDVAANQHKRRTPSIAQSVASSNSIPSTIARTRTREPAVPQQKNAVWAMEFSVCGKYLAAGGQDGVVRIWRVAPFAREQEREKKQSPKPTPSASASPRSMSPQRQRAAEAGANAGPTSEQQGDIATAKAGRMHGRHQSLVVGDAQDMMPFANSAPIARARNHRRSASGQHDSAGGALQQVAVPATLHEDSERLECATADKECDGSSAVVAAQLHPMHAFELLEPVPFRSYAGHSADVLALSWSKNGFLLSASMDRTVRLWHPHRPECLCTFRHHDIVTSVAFNPRDDRLFVSGSLDCRLRLWDIPARGVKLWTSLPEGQMVTSVAFTSARGDHIVAGTYRGMCVFYSTDTLAVQGRMHARSSRGRNAKGSKITGFATAPTGQLPPALARRLLGPAALEALSSLDSKNYRLLVSSNDSRLRMFFPRDRIVERKYKGHANASSQAYARLSSDARYVVSGSEDHNIYIWSAAQDNAATVATHPESDHIRRVGRVAARSNAAAAAAAAATTNTASASSAKGSGITSRNPLLATLFGKRRSQSDSKDAVANDDKSVQQNNSAEWESLDGKVEEKSIYEYFPAHDAAVSQALFAPAATLQYLADHDDPILSRPKIRFTGASGEVENALHASADGTFGGHALHTSADSGANDADSAAVAKMVEDMTAIIVSADTLGNIRVFRKDINMRRRHGVRDKSQKGLRNESCSSLLKLKESIGSLSQHPANHSIAITVDDVSAHSMPPSRQGTMDQKQADGFRKSLQIHRGSESSSGTKPQGVISPSAVPTFLATQRPAPTFWNRLGRKLSQKRSSSTFAGTSNAAATIGSGGNSAENHNSLRMRARAASGGNVDDNTVPHLTSAALPFVFVQNSSSTPATAIPPLVVLSTSEPGHGASANKSDNDACNYCGHSQFLEFAVSGPAPPDGDDDTGANNTKQQQQQLQKHTPSHPPTLLVCKNCKRVKDMPE